MLSFERFVGVLQYAQSPNDFIENDKFQKRKGKTEREVKSEKKGTSEREGKSERESKSEIHVKIHEIFMNNS